MSRLTNRAQALLGSMVLVLTCASIAVAQGERVFTANQIGGNVTAFDTDKVNAGGDAVDFRVPDNVSAPIPAYAPLAAPTEVALNPMLQYGYTTEQLSGSVAVFDVLSNDNIVGALSFGGQIATRIQLSIPLPFGMAVTPDGRLGFVGNGERIVSPPVTARADEVGNLVGPAIISATSDLVSILDLERNVEIGTIDIAAFLGGPAGPVDVATSPDGSLLYIACATSQSVVIVDVATLTFLANVALPLGVDQLPIQIAVAPDNTFVYVAAFDFTAAATGAVVVFDVPTLTPSPVVLLGGAAAINPVDVFLTPDSALLYVNDAGNDDIQVVSVATQSAFAVILEAVTVASVTRGTTNEAGTLGFVADFTGSVGNSFNVANSFMSRQFPCDAGPIGIAVKAVALLSAAGAANVQRAREGREDRNKGLCFVATASYGNTGEVASLRAFRDLYLMPTKFGRSFVDLYYESSPGLASVISGRDEVRASIRGGLTPVVWAASLVMGAGNGLTAAVAGLLALALGAGVGRRLLASGRRAS